MTVRERLRWLFESQAHLDLTSGRIVRPLTLLALPVVVTNLIQTSYTLVDTFWLAGYSTTALASISLAFPLAFLLLALGFGLPIAGSIHVAQAVGGDDEREAGFVAAQTTTVALAFAVLVGAVAFLGVEHLVGLFDVVPAVARQTTLYLQLLSLGLPATTGFIAYSALMRGSGNTMTPLAVMVGTIALNVALDPPLIFGWGPLPELGVLGAGASTVFARVVGTVVGMWLLFGSEKGFEVSARQFVPDPVWVRRLVRTGAPTSLEETGRAISNTLLLVAVGTFSTAVVAGYGLGLRLLSMVFLTTTGVAKGVETMTAQSVGAEKVDRAARVNYLAAGLLFVVMSVIAIESWVVARPLMALFTSDPAVVDTATTMTRWVAPTFGCMGVMRAFVGGFRGIGRTTVAAAIVLSVLGVVRLAVAFAGIGPLGPTAIWLALAVSNAVGALLALAWFRLDFRTPAREITDDTADGERPTTDD